MNQSVSEVDQSRIGVNESGVGSNRGGMGGKRSVTPVPQGLMRHGSVPSLDQGNIRKVALGPGGKIFERNR